MASGTLTKPVAFVTTCCNEVISVAITHFPLLLYIRDVPPRLRSHLSVQLHRARVLRSSCYLAIVKSPALASQSHTSNTEN